MSAKSIKIIPPKGYDLLNSVHSWIFPDVQPVPEVTVDGLFSRIISIGDHEIPITIHQVNGTLITRYPHDNVTVREVEDKVRFLLGLDVNISAALKFLRQESLFDPILDSLKSIRPYSSDSIFEGLMKTVLQQQISYRAANVITKRAVMELASSVEFEGSRVYSFPKPHSFVEAGVEKLRELGIGYKSDYVLNIASLVHKKELELERFRNRDQEFVTSILKPIHGIGEWTIQVLAIAALNDFSVYPFGDLGIQNLLGKLYNDGHRVTTKYVYEYSQNVGNSGPMVLYLLMCADVLGWLEESR